MDAFAGEQDAERLRRLVGVQLRIVQSASRFDDLLCEIATEAQALTGAEAAAVELIEGDELVYRACSGTLAGSVGARLKVAGSLSGIAMRDNQVLSAIDTETDERVDRAACRRLGIRAMVVTPLYEGHRPVGVLKVAAAEPGGFAEADLGILRILGELIAGALNRQSAAEASARLLAERTEALARVQAAEADAQEARLRAEAADQAKTDFLANMSHELRTPLTTVIGFAGLLAATGQLGDKERRFAEKIRGASQNLLTLVNDLLDHSKLEAGQLELAPEPVDLRPFLGDALDFLTVQAQTKGVALTLEVEDSLSEELFVDGHRLRQVLLNLLANAVKFTETGSVTLRARSAAGARIAFDVVDTGPGIPPDKLARLFQRYAQAEGATAKTHGGTGLGLAISKALVELLGGTLTVASRIGAGSTFSFSIPVRARSRTRRLSVVA